MKNVKLKHFHYISKMKIDILEPQLNKALFSFELHPKIELPGFSLEVDAQKAPAGSGQVQRLLPLLNKLKKSRLLKSLEEVTSLDPKIYYGDEGEWYHGLFSFKDETDSTRVILYLLWRFWKDAILLLAGSPLNILGENIIREGVTCDGTSGTFESIYKFANQNLKTDETTAIRTGGTDRDVIQTELKSIPWVAWDTSAFQERTQPLLVQLTASPSPLALGILCVQYLNRLPQEEISTVFKLYRKLPFRRSAELPFWVTEVLKNPSLNNEMKNQFFHCKTIYIGSPLYTALVES